MIFLAVQNIRKAQRVADPMSMRYPTSCGLDSFCNSAAGYIDKVGSRRAFAMGTKQLRGLNLILLVVHELTRLLPVPFAAQLIDSLRKIVEEYSEKYTADENSADVDKKLRTLENKIQELSQLLPRADTPVTEDTAPDYRGVLNVMLNELPIHSVTIRPDSLLTALAHDNIIIAGACFLGPIRVSHTLSSLFNNRWPLKWRDATICVNFNTITMTFPRLHAFLALNDDKPRHVEGVLTIPIATNAHFELLTAYDTSPVMEGHCSRLDDIMLSRPVEIKVPGMQATRVELSPSFDTSIHDRNTFALIVPRTNGEELENGPAVASSL